MKLSEIVLTEDKTPSSEIVDALKKAKFADISEDNGMVHFTRHKRNTVDKFTVEPTKDGLVLTVQGYRSDLPVGTFMNMPEVLDGVSSVNQKWFNENDVEN